MEVVGAFRRAARRCGHKTWAEIGRGDEILERGVPADTSAGAEIECVAGGPGLAGSAPSGLVAVGVPAANSLGAVYHAFNPTLPQVGEARLQMRSSRKSWSCNSQI